MENQSKIKQTINKNQSKIITKIIKNVALRPSWRGLKAILGGLEAILAPRWAKSQQDPQKGKEWGPSSPPPKPQVGVQNQFYSHPNGDDSLICFLNRLLKAF